MTAATILARIELAPLVPWPLLAVLTALVLTAGAWALWRRVAGTPWRLLAAATLLAALADPRLVEEERRALPDVVLVMVDDSPSQRLGERPRQTETALDDLRRRLASLPNLEIRVRREAGGLDGTRLFTAMDAALADLPRRRLAGVVAITDGRVHDAPATALDAPLHVLLTGRRDERDRRVAILRAPGYALVGRHAQVKLRVDDPGQSGAVPLSVRVDGRPYLEASVPLNTDATIEVPTTHAGAVIVEVESPAPAGDLLPANNRAAIAIPTVRDRMKVLLISGEPHAGERVWRNLLKSDPAVDLVHFTILRPPEKDDRTPIRELSLITFPVRELFEEKLKDFDLVVFDRYRHRGVMAAPYYQLLEQYVRGGGALLAAVGPEFTEPDGLGNSALADILPALPDGGALEGAFVPTLTVTGRRHPVTSDLPNPAAWGPWLRQMSARADAGRTLLTGAGGKPLLVLDQVGQGRIAQVLSDTVWLWARGYQGGGPHDEMLRRLAHWLMREPELETEALRAEIRGERLHVTWRTLADTAPETSVTAPDGTSQLLPLTDQGDGRWVAETAASQPGLWRVQAAEQVALAAQGGVDSPELAEVTATAETLRPATEASGGSIRFLAEDGVPEPRRVATAGGRGLGLLRRDDYVVGGVRQTPLLPAPVTLGLIVLGLLMAWRRESR